MVEDSSLLRVDRTWDPPYGQVRIFLDGSERAAIGRGQTYSTSISVGSHVLTVLSPEGGRAEAIFVAGVEDRVTFRCSAPAGLSGYMGYYRYNPEDWLILTRQEECGG